MNLRPAFALTASAIRSHGAEVNGLMKMQAPEQKQLRYFLPAAPRQVNIFADASFRHELGVGVWAYRVPVFGLRMCVLEEASSVHRLEVVAVVRAIQRLECVEHAGRSLVIHSDSDVVRVLVERAQENRRLPSRRLYSDLTDLDSRIREMTLRRSISVVNAGLERTAHSDCDRDARIALRTFCDVNKGALEYAAKMEQARKLCREHFELRTRLRHVELELSRFEPQLQTTLAGIV